MYCLDAGCTFSTPSVAQTQQAGISRASTALAPVCSIIRCAAAQHLYTCTKSALPLESVQKTFNQPCTFQNERQSQEGSRLRC